jgi:hypothetical protein
VASLADLEDIISDYMEFHESRQLEGSPA